MSTLNTAVGRHRPRIITEVESALWHDNPGLRAEGRERLRAEVEQLLDALLERVRLADSPLLAKLAREQLASGRYPITVLCGALVRLAAAVRSVLLLEVTNRRVFGIASAGVDRAAAEAIEELDAAVPGSAVPAAPGIVAPRCPTMIRNIREILSSAGGEVGPASLVAVALQDAAAVDAEPDEREQLEALRCRVLQLAREAGAQVVHDTPTLVAAAISARVGDADAVDAVSLGLALQRAPELSRCGFGLARGPIRIEADSSGDAGAGSGSALVRALSLATTAKPGVILSDAGIQAVAGETYALRQVTTTTPAFRLDPDQPQWLDRWEQAALVAEPELVGQATALRQLKHTLRSPGRRVKLVGLRGRPGAGKLRLLKTALAELELPAERLLVGQPHPLAQAPYWPLITIVRKLLGLDDGPVREATLRQRLQQLAARSAVTASLKNLLPTVSALLGTEETDEALLDAAEPATLRAEIARTLRTLLEAAADQQPDRPLVIVLREVESTDLPTMQALAHVVNAYQGAAQLVVALCYRGTFRPPSTLAAAGVSEIGVEPLSEAEVVRLACSMLDQDELPEEIAPLLRDPARRLPLMAATLVRYLVELGVLYRRDGIWERGSPIKPADIPRRLGDLIARRIERLPAGLASLLKSAATVGEPFAWGTLELVWVSRGVAHDELQRSVGLLEEMGFLQRDADGTLQFAHPLIRQVAYCMQTEEERRETHRLAVVAYQERYPDAIRQIPAVLFRHCVESGDPDGAVQAAIHAVRRGSLLQDHKRGLAVAAEALALATEPSEDGLRARFDLLAARERIHDARGTREAQKADIKELVGIAEQLRDDRRLGLALHRAARLNLLTGDLARARAVAGKALARLRTGDPLHLSNALRTLALIRWQERDPAEAAAALNESLGIYERLGHRRGMGFVLHNLGLFALDTGALRQALLYFERALELKEETGDDPGKAAVLDCIGQVALLEGGAELAADRFEQALELRQTSGDTAGRAPTQVSLGQAILDRDPARAEQLARAALEGCRTRRQASTKAEAGMLLAQALLRQGSRGAASRAASQALRGAEAAGGQLLLVRAGLVRAEVDLAYRGRTRAAAAVEQARAAAEIALRAGAVRWRIEALSVLALAQSRLEPAGGAEPAREALTLLTARTPVGLDAELVQRRCQAALETSEQAEEPGAKRRDHQQV